MKFNEFLINNHKIGEINGIFYNSKLIFINKSKISNMINNLHSQMKLQACKKLKDDKLEDIEIIQMNEKQIHTIFKTKSLSQ